MPLDCRDVPGGVRIAVRVRPRASRTEVEGTHGGALVVRLTAPPVEGAANAALVDAIAEWLGIGRRNVSIVRGDTGRRKVVEAAGVTTAQVLTLVSKLTTRGG